MKTLTINTLYTNLLKTADSVTPFGLSKLLAPIAVMAYVSGRVQIPELNKLRTMETKNVRPIQIATGKSLPITWDKENQTYKLNSTKRDEIIAELELFIPPHGQKLTEEQQQSNLDILQSWILTLISPQDKPEDDKPKVAKAWTESQYKSQAAKLSAMDNDQLAAQLKMLQALLTQAQHEQDTRITSFLGSKPTATTPEQLAEVC